MPFYYILVDWVVPFPLQVHCLSLFFRHQADFEVLVLNHRPLLIFSAYHQSSNSINPTILVSFFMKHVLIKCILQLNSSLPAMTGRKTASNDGISFPIHVFLFRISPIMNVDIFNLVEL